MAETRTAGRELNAEIAVTMFGWEWRRSAVTGCRCVYAPNRAPSWMRETADLTEPLVVDWDYGEWTPRYSTDIAAAWLVVERMFALGYNADVFTSTDGYGCDFTQYAHDTRFSARVDPREGGVPLAICLAALKAMEPRW